MPVHQGPLPIDVFEPLAAKLIYDGGNDVTLPRQLLPKVEADASAGTQAAYDKALALILEAKQMQGTPVEQLCEVAGRNCYDSFGRGRTSVDFHKHILEVGHLSVIEHPAITVELATRRPEHVGELANAFLNRPGVWVSQSNPYVLRATLNLRHINEWWQWKSRLLMNPDVLNLIGWGLRSVGHAAAPQIVAQPDVTEAELERVTAQMLDDGGPWFMLKRTRPETAEECWVTLLLTGSRGFSHELVRHGDYTAISQRSTRYVDESESPWVMHPLEQAELLERVTSTEEMVDPLINDCGSRYKSTVGRLEPWLVSKGVDKVSARKQARGAARGYLGNALYTEVVFSASVAQWRRMLRQRLNPAADAEIREVFYQALIELKRSAHARFFTGWTTEPSPDGIGQVLDGTPE